jgi:hypothetical protein
MSRVIGGISGFLLVCFGIGWAVQGNEFFMYKFFAPKEEAVRRETFEQSKAYNDGMAQELSQMQLDYAKATPDQKAALRSVAIHRYASYDASRLPRDLQDFLQQMRHDATTVRP